MTDDQIKDLCGVLESGFKMLSLELDDLRSEVTGVATAVQDATDELERIKVEVRHLAQHGIDVAVVS